MADPVVESARGRRRPAERSRNPELVVEAVGLAVVGVIGLECATVSALGVIAGLVFASLVLLTLAGVVQARGSR